MRRNMGRALSAILAEAMVMTSIPVTAYAKTGTGTNIAATDVAEPTAAGSAQNRDAAALTAAGNAQNEEAAAQTSNTGAQEQKTQTSNTGAQEQKTQTSNAEAQEATDAAEPTAAGSAQNIAAAAQTSNTEAQEQKTQTSNTEAQEQKTQQANTEAQEPANVSANTTTANTTTADTAAADTATAGTATANYTNSSEIVDYDKYQLIYIYNDNDKTPEEVAAAYEAAFREQIQDKNEQSNFTISAKPIPGVKGIAVLSIGKNTGYTAEDILNLQNEAGKDKALPTVHANFYRKLCASEEVEYNDPYLKDEEFKYRGKEDTDNLYQWFHDRIYSKKAWPVTDNYERTSVVALIDTGVDAGHTELADSVVEGFAVDTRDLTKPSDKIISTDADETGDNFGHGTNMAGIIAAARENGIGGRGVGAGVVSVMPAKVFTNDDNETTDLDILIAMKYIAQHKSDTVDVINIGYGGYHKSLAYEQVINEVRDKGITIVAPAGNENSTGDFFPASNKGVISVAATTIKIEDKLENGKTVRDSNNRIARVIKDIRANDTNTGSGVDLCAPGGDKRTDGFQIATTATRNDGYEHVTGTSAASAIVAATAALLRAKDKTLHPDTVEAKLKETARVVDDFKDMGMGAGIVDVAKALGIDKNGAKITASPKNNAVLDKKKSSHTITLTCSNTKATMYYDITGYKEGTEIFQTDPVKYDTDKKITYKLTEEEEDRVELHVTARDAGDILIAEETFTYYFNPTAESIKITTAGKLLGVAVGKTLQLKAAIEPKLTKSNGVTWESNDTKLATVDSKGVVTGRAEGFVTITAKSKDNEAVTESITLRITPRTTQLLFEGIKELNPNEYYEKMLKCCQDPVTVNKYDTIRLTPRIEETGIVKDVASGATYDEEGKWDLRPDIITLGVSAYPRYTEDSETKKPVSGALPTFKVESSKPDIVSVRRIKFELDEDKNEIVDDERFKWELRALKSGEATITITSLDGYEAKTTFDIKVETPIKHIIIEDTGAIPSKTVTPKVSFPYYNGYPYDTYNNGYDTTKKKLEECIKPDSPELVFSLYNEGITYAVNGITASTGKFTVKSRDELVKLGVDFKKNPRPKIDIMVVSPKYGVTDYGKITLYEATTAIEMNKDMEGRVLKIDDKADSFSSCYKHNGKPVRNSNLVKSVKPVDEETAESLANRKFLYKTSNPKVIKFTNPRTDKNGKEIPTESEDGAWEAVGPGKVKLTIETTDGTQKKGEINLIVENDLKIAIKNRQNRYSMYYGCKELTLNAVAIPSNQSLKRDYVKWYLDKDSSVSNPAYETENKYLRVKKADKGNDGIITLKSSCKNLTAPKKVNVYLEYNEYDTVKTVMTEITIYPSATQAVYVTEKQMVFSELGQRKTIQANSFPDECCQDGYTYKTSDAKVAKVYTNGEVEAVGNGTATITVTAGDGTGKKTTFKAVVKQATNVEEIYGKDKKNYVMMGSSLKMSAKFNKNAVDKKLKWNIVSCSPEDIEKYCSINETSGVLKVKQPDDEDAKTREYTVVVRATPQNPREPEIGFFKGDVYAECEIQIYPKRTRMKRTGSTMKLEVGESEAVGFVDEAPEDKELIAILTNTGAARRYKIKSSNTKVADVSYYEYQDGTIDDFVIEAKGKGNATITVSAQDGSGKSVKLPVSVTRPVESVTAYVRKTAEGEYITEKSLMSGKSVKLYSVCNNGEGASNTAVKWQFVDEDDKTYATLSGSEVKAKKVTEQQEVRVIAISKSDTGIESEPVSIMIYPDGVNKIELREEGSEVKATKTTLCTETPQGDVSPQKVYDIVVSGKKEGSNFSTDLLLKNDNPKAVEAELVNEGGSTKLKVQAGEKTGTANVTVYADDGSGKKAALKVTVVNPIRDILVRSKNGSTNLAAGYSLQMQALVDSKVSNKAVKWELVDVDGNPFNKSIAKIDGKGKITTTANSVSQKTSIYVKATAKDAGGFAPDPTEITLYAKSGGIGVIGKLNVTVKSVNDEIVFRPIEKNHENYCDRYKVTYKAKKGVGRVVYRELSGEVGTGITVYGSKAGKIEVTVEAKDGSGMKAKYEINVTTR